MSFFKLFNMYHLVIGRKQYLVCLLQFIIILCASNPALAQRPEKFSSPGQPRGELPPLLEERQQAPLPGLVVPDKPSLDQPTAPKSPALGRIKKIVIEGATVFSSDELNEIINQYIGQPLSNEIIEEIRHALTVFYIRNGFINSGAIVPDQAVKDGVITFKIIEGNLTFIDVKDNKWFRDSYIEDRLNLDPDQPLNINTLQKRLQLLQHDHRISHINAELKPGVDMGDSLLNVKVEERSPYQIQIGFDNYQSPSIGSERGLLTLIHQNLTGNGDILNLNTALTEDNDPQLDIWYSIPLNRYDTSLIFWYSRKDMDIIDGVFEDLDINSESEVFQIELRHPFYRTLSTEFSMSLIGEHNKNETSLLGEPFSFSPGAEDGETKNTIIRFSQEWTQRTQNQVFAVRSRFSLGIDALDATKHSGDLPDGQFFAWLGQIQWARIFPFLDTQLIFETDVQLSDDPLLGMEQISIGGRHTVRGYRENTMVRDQAVISTLEARIPIIRDSGITEYLQVAAFADYGNGWNKNRDTPSLRHISSVGLGLRWGGIIKKPSFLIRPKFEIYWGQALKNVDTPDDDLQDDGIHFQFLIQNFY